MSFLAFAASFLARLEAWEASGVIPSEGPNEPMRPGIPKRYGIETTFEEEGGIYHRPFVKTDYWHLIWCYLSDPLWETKEAEQCALYWKKVVGHRHRSRWEFPFDRLPKHLQTSDLLLNGLVIPVIDVVERHETFKPTQEQLLESYARFLAERMDPDVHWSVLLPLVNFSSDLEREESISPRFKLSPFTFEEKEAAWDLHTGDLSRMEVLPSVSIRAFHNTYFKLTSSYAERREIHESRSVLDKAFSGKDPEMPIERQQMFDELEDVITALRLMRAGDVYVLCCFEHTRSMTPTRFRVKSIISQRRLDQSHFHFAEADLSRVRALYTSLQSLGKQKSGLAVALRRFNDSYGRDIREDQIIDLAIALESSLLAGDKERTKKDKLAARGAALLAATRNPSETEALLKEMYKARNGIVHGGMLLSELGKHPTEFPQHSENIVRDILKAYMLRLANGQSVAQVNQEVEKRSVDGFALTSTVDGEERNNTHE